jgi:5'-3' exonuclease
MGILNFHKWLKQKYNNQYTQIKETIKVENFYIDLNFVLHNCISGVQKLEDLYKRLFNFLDNVFSFIIPTKTLTFATDGPAPYAKIILQRSRRLQMVRNKDIEFNNTSITPLHFTPGSIFMKELENKMNEYLKKLNDKLQVKIYTLMSGPDEAEIKLVKKITELNKKPEEKHVILSNDADIVVIFTSLEKYNNLQIVKKEKGYFLFDIGQLVNDIKKEVNNNNIICHRDFSLTFLLMGNDYFPKMKYTSVEKIYKAFQNTYSVYTGENKKSLLINDNNFNINKETFRDYLYNIVIQTNKVYLNKFKIIEFNRNMYKRYVEGLIWCIKMYSTGNCIEYDYIFNFKETPHPLGLLYYFEFYYEEDFIEKKIYNSTPIPDEIYSLFVLPKKAQNMINKKYHELMNTKLKFLYEEEECNECIKQHKNIADIYETIKFMKIMDEDTSSIRRKVGKISVELGKHKKKHKTLTINDIKNILKLCEK